jgi:hypothetical protein
MGKTLKSLSLEDIVLSDITSLIGRPGLLLV